MIGLLRGIGGFVIRALFLALGGAVAVAASRYGAGYDPGGPGSGTLAVPLFIDSLTWVLYPALLISFGISMLRLVFLDRGRFFVGLLVFITAFGLLGSIHTFGPNLRSVAPLRPGTVAPVVRSGGVTRFPDADVFVGARERFSLLDIVLFSREEPRGFSYVPEGFVDPFNRQVEISGPAGDTLIDLDTAQSGPAVLFRPPILVTGFAETIIRSGERFMAHRNSDPLLFWVETGAFMLALTGVWAFAHMSRWPLLNGIVVVVVALLLPAVHVLLYDPDVYTLYGLVFADDVVFAAPALVLAGLGLAMQVLGLLMPPARRIRREVEE